MPLTSWLRILRVGLPLSLASMAVALLVLASCGSESSYSLTQPKPVLVTGDYFLNLNQDSETRSLEVQLLVDDVVLYSGPLFTGSPWDLDPYPLYLSGSLGNLSAGRHTLTLRVTRQEVSPASYRVSANVKLGSQQVASWDEWVTLGTGESWIGEFVLGDSSGTWDY